MSRDIPRVLAAIKCESDLKGEPLPAGYNAAVMRVKRIFDEEVRRREAERRNSLSLTLGQCYVMRELGSLFRATEDEDRKGQLALLEKAFRNPLTRALQKELNLLRRNGVAGGPLLKSLANLYHQHNLHEWLDRRPARPVDEDYPRIVCSEAPL